MVNPVIVEVHNTSQYTNLFMSNGRKRRLLIGQAEFIAKHFVGRFYVNTTSLKGQERNTWRSLIRSGLVINQQFWCVEENKDVLCQPICAVTAMIALGLNKETHFGFKTQEGPLSLVLGQIRSGELLWGDVIARELDEAVEFLSRLGWIHPPEGDIIMLSPEGLEYTKEY